MQSEESIASEEGGSGRSQKVFGWELARQSGHRGPPYVLERSRNLIWIVL